MTEMILLGAGASIEAGIPGAYRMTEDMISKISENYGSRSHAAVLYFVASGLLHRYGALGQNPFEGINVEELFNAIQLLANRDELEITPFVYSWSPYVDELETKFSQPESYKMDKLIDSLYKPLKDIINKKRSKSSEDIFSEIQKARFRSDYHIRKNFNEIVQSIVKTHRSRIFERTLELMIDTLKNIVWIQDSSSLDYLIPLVKNAFSQKISISTLNYDNSIELVGKRNSVLVDTGILEWSSNGNFRFAESALHLLKLHGSINWRLIDKSSGKDNPMPKQSIEEIMLNPNPAEKDTFHPALIFGGTNKLTAKGPFLDLLRTFRENLMTSSTLTVIGYSFRDEHVNEYISQWINNDANHRIRIVDPRFDNYDDEYHMLLRNLDANRIDILRENASSAIEKLYS